MAQAITFSKSAETNKYVADIKPTKDTVVQLTFQGNTGGNRIDILRSVDGTNFAPVVSIPYNEPTFCKGLSGVVNGETIRIVCKYQPIIAQYI